MADFSSNEDRLLRGALGKTPDCPSIEALENPDAKGRAHVESCAYCRNERAMLAEFQESAPLPEDAAAVAWIESDVRHRPAVLAAGHERCSLPVCG